MNIDHSLPDSALILAAGLDRALARRQGNSVCYLVAELSPSPTSTSGGNSALQNLALAIDISGSMAGGKIDEARRTACAVVDTLTGRDRLSIVAFNARADLLLDGRATDDAGRAEAIAAISQLTPAGNTNLFDGWLLAAERVALAMRTLPQASPRVLLLSDGQTNAGLTDPAEIAMHAGALLERGVITTAIGFGNDYNEALLGAIAEAGGGNLHDAAQGEIREVVLGELDAARAAMAERITLRLSVPADLRAEVVGAWAHAVRPGVIEVMAGGLLPGQTKRVVFRLHPPAGPVSMGIPLSVSADGALPGGGALVEALPIELELRRARTADYNAQARNAGRSLVVVQAWQAETLRRVVGMNRDGDRQAAKHFLERELSHLERYARDIPGTETLVGELIMVQRRVSEAWDERTRKELYTAAHKRSRSEDDLRSAPRASIAERFGSPPGQS